MKNSQQITKYSFLKKKTFWGIVASASLLLAAHAYAQGTGAAAAAGQNQNNSAVKVYHDPPQVTMEETFFNDMDPFLEMQRMRESMNNLFMQSMSRMHAGSPFQAYSDTDAAFAPDLDFKDTGKDYVMQMDLPGMDKSKISVEVTRDVLRIGGEREEVQEETDANDSYFHRERSYGRFERVIPMPQDADSEKIDADYANGILTVHLGKIPGKEDKNQPKKIAVK